MGNTAINNLSYTGIVTISQYSNGKKIPLAQYKNTGGNSLFSFLSNCLVGDFDTAKFEKPVKIMLLQTDADEKNSEMTIRSASDFVYYLNSPEKISGGLANTSCSVCYHFIIPRDILQDTAFNSIGLYSDLASITDVDQFMAFCKIDSNIGVSASAVLVVDWQLIITNNTQEGI